MTSTYKIDGSQKSLPKCKICRDRICFDLDDDGEARDITSQDVNDYLREITGEDFTAKDIRTWAERFWPRLP